MTFEKWWKTFRGVKLPDQMPRRYECAQVAWETQQAEIDRLKRGEFTPAEANAMVAAVVERHRLTRAQCETAIWEWQDKVFGPRQTDGTAPKIGATGYDGTYPVAMDKLPHVAESTPGQQW